MNRNNVAFNTLRWGVKNFISSTGYGFYFITRNVVDDKSIIVNQKTDLMIEGYPRSANTFCVAALQYMNNDSIRIARHRHETGHFIYATKLNIPVLILIRQPKDAISSFIIREQVSTKFAIKYYNSYYSTVLKYISCIQIGPFDIAVNRYDLLVEKVNTKFNTSFKFFPLEDNDLTRIRSYVRNMEQIDSGNEYIRKTHVAYPTKERQELKKYIFDDIEKYGSIFKKSCILYKQILKMY